MLGHPCYYVNIRSRVFSVLGKKVHKSENERNRHCCFEKKVEIQLNNMHLSNVSATPE